MAVNIASINNKLNRVFKSSGFKSRLAEYSENIVKEAADKFISILQARIDSSGLSAEVVAEINSLERDDSPAKIRDDLYSISIQFSGDMTRPSLNPNDELDNLAFLLNDGFGPTRRAVRGVWHSRSRGEDIMIVGLRGRDGRHFIDDAIKDFMDGYAKEYGVTEIQVNQTIVR